jgi:hypothetical protein
MTDKKGTRGRVFEVSKERTPEAIEGSSCFFFGLVPFLSRKFCYGYEDACEAA